MRSASPPSGPAVAVRGAGRQFDNGTVAFEPITLDVPPGQFVALLGPSGCGKSTLLRLIAGLDRPTVGTVETPFPTRQSFVFQDAHLLPWRTVLANVALPLELSATPNAEHAAFALGALAQVGMAEAASLYPAQLSGGMRMRVSLARALVTRPLLLLLDEPFAALDEITRQQLDDLLRTLWRTLDMTVLFVTHSIAEAVYLADRVVVFSRRPSRIVLDHPVALDPVRTSAVRATSAFAAETGVLLDALQRGSA